MSKETDLEDLSFIREAISLCDAGLNTRDDRLKFLGLLYIIETYHNADMQSINAHDSKFIGSIMTVCINEKGDSKYRFKALRYTLEKLKEKVREKGKA